MQNEISPLSVFKQYVQGPASQKDESTEQVILKGERTLPMRGLMVQEGGFKMDGDMGECGKESISLMDVLVTGTVYLADPDMLSLTAKNQRKRIWILSNLQCIKMNKYFCIAQQIQN